MPESLPTDEKRWFVLNFIRRPGKQSPQKDIDDFNRDGQRLELFAPIIRPAKIIDGKVVYKDQLLTYFYVFAKGTADDVKQLCALPNNDLSLMIDHGSDKRYGMLTDAEMENFKIIARAYTNSIPFFDINDIDLQAGDKVEVIDGPFAGITGTFIPKPRSSKGNLVIAATADMGTIVWDIDARYVRILQFAPDTRRPYDLLDSFIPRLYPALRHFHAKQRLTEREKSQLTVFSQRMGVVALSNQKAEAKLLATLMCAQFIIGDMEGYSLTEARYEKRKTAVTNPWTQALIELMAAVSLGDMPRLGRAYAAVKDLAPSPTKPQNDLLEEFRHYLHN